MFETRNSFRLSIANRLSAGKVKEEKLAYELYLSAHASEIDAINMQCRIYAVMTDRIVEYISVDETDYTLINSYDNSATENFKNRFFAVRDVSLPYNYYTFRDKNVSPDVNNNNNVNHENVNTYTGKGGEYRIQIGTSIIPANKTQVNRLNSTDLEVKTYKSKVYYKYTIGSFASFNEAKNFKNAYGLAKTYIVEYRFLLNRRHS